MIKLVDILLVKRLSVLNAILFCSFLNFLWIPGYTQVDAIHRDITITSQEQAKSEGEKELKDNFQQYLIANKDEIEDSIKLRDKEILVKQVHTEKYINRLCDSLKRKIDFEHYKGFMKSLKESDENLAEAVRQRLPQFPGVDQYGERERELEKIKKIESLSSLNSSSVPIPSSSSLSSSLPSLPSLPSVPYTLPRIDPSSIASLPALQAAKFPITMPDSLLSQLKPMQGSQLKTTYLDKIEGIRKINLKENRLKLTEEKVSEQAKAVIFEKRDNFWSKSYFEGLVGIIQGSENLKIVQLSPAIGYHFLKNTSIGIGPNINIHTEKDQIRTLFGVHSFIKQEFFDKTTYLQLEDVANFPSIMSSEVNVPKKSVEHSVLFGGGYVLMLSKATALNFSLLYRIVENRASASTSPWVFRIGLSSIKKEGKKPAIK